ncbi:MAG TPA: class I SAM-dependent methyltransferase [Dehalococcoidia bacterium]
MPDRDEQERLSSFLLDLYGPDPFAEIRAASESHRVAHAASLTGGEQECGVYPSDMLKMRVFVTVARATGSRRVLEIGGGLGYSALWLADAIGEDGHVETIDRFPEHIEEIDGYAERFGLMDRVTALQGEGAELLRDLQGPYDLIHDDGWFAVQPPYYERLAGLLRPGGLLVMSNWFLLEHAATGQSPVDWAEFAGPSWADDVKAYAGRLSADERYDVSFVQRPALALARRRADA